MGGGGGHGAFLRKAANLSDVDSAQESQINLGLLDNAREEQNITLGTNAGNKFTESLAYRNIAIGRDALSNTDTEEDSQPTNNTAVGYKSMLNTTNAQNNSAFGINALRSNTTGFRNTAIGANSMNNFQDNINTGNENTAVGHQSLRNNTSGSNNTAIGQESLRNKTAGSYNTAIGSESLRKIVTGDYNTAIGYQSGITEDDNCEYSITIGYNTKAENRSIVIGNRFVERTFIGEKTAGGEPTSIRDVSGLNLNGFQLYVLPTGEIVRGAAVNPIP